MSDPKHSDKVLGPNSIGSEIIEVGPDGWDTRVRPMSEVLEELRAEARRRAEQQDSPPKDNGETGGP